MEAGTTPWRRPWGGTASGPQANLLSGRHYRGANPALLLLGMQLRGSVLPWWCGFAEARSHGLVPRRGSQGVPILRPLRCTPASDDDETSSVTRMLFRPIVVFNAIDLQGEGLEALIAGRRRAARQGQAHPAVRLREAEAVLRRWPVAVQHGADQAAYLPEADRIRMPPRQDFEADAAYLATLAHECIHSTGHASRLGRDLSGSYGSAAYAREELVAELGAALIGERLAIGSDTANHAAYLAPWVSLLRAQPRLLFDVLAEAARAADLIAPEPPSGAD